MRHRSLPLSLLIVVAAAAGGADDIAIARYGTTLVVTAPDEAGDPATRARLAQRVTLDLADTPVAEAAALIGRMTGLATVVMPAVAATPVTLQVRDMALSSALDWIGQQARIHVGVDHQALVFSDQPVRGPERTRLYDVADLVLPIRDFPGPELAFTDHGVAMKGTVCFPTDAADGHGRDQALDQLERTIRTVVGADTAR